MAAEQRHVDPEGTFEIELPKGWLAKPDVEEGGLEIWHPEGFGVLHLIGFRQDPGEVPDPAEELYAFLDEQGIEIEEDEVEDIELRGGAEMAFCEFIAEEEGEGEEDNREDEGAVFWRVGVATAPGSLIFASYSCPAGEEEQESQTIQTILNSIRPL